MQQVYMNGVLLVEQWTAINQSLPKLLDGLPDAGDRKLSTEGSCNRLMAK
jgi:hypothetical protein